MANSRKWFYNTRTQSKVKLYRPEWYNYIEECYIDAMKQKLDAERKLKEIRLHLLNIMNAEKVDVVKTKKTYVSIIRAYKGRRVDSSRLKRDYPKIFIDYSTPYVVGEHLQVTIKGKEDL